MENTIEKNLIPIMQCYFESDNAGYVLVKLNSQKEIESVKFNVSEIDIKQYKNLFKPNESPKIRSIRSVYIFMVIQHNDNFYKRKLQIETSIN